VEEVLSSFFYYRAVLNLPVVIIARVISQQKAEGTKKSIPYTQKHKMLMTCKIAALKSSTVKVAGRDVLATWKLLVGLVLVPSLYYFYSFLVFLVLLKTSTFEFKTIMSISVATWFAIAGVSYASLRSGEVGLDIAK
jgi:hypothetical protein